MSYSVAPSTQAVIEGIINRNEQGISRAQIAQHTGLSSSTVSNVVRALIEAGLVDESPGASTGGRRTQLLRPTKRHAPVWVAEIGNNHARIGVLDRPGHIVASTDIPVDLAQPPRVALSVIIQALQELSRATIGKDQPDSLGLALPGPVAQDQKMVIGAARMGVWNNVPLEPILHSMLDCPIFLDNDARAGAIGEFALRTPETHALNGIYVKAGTGIGGAAIIDGAIYTGGFGLAGDIAHNPIPEAEGIACPCGRFGCVETIASGSGIIRRLHEQGITVPDIMTLIDQAQQWDPQVTTMLRNAGTYVGRVLAPLVTFLNPSHLIIGGSMSSIDSFTAGIRSELYALCLPMTTTNLIIEASISKADAALLGMANACFQHLERV